MTSFNYNENCDHWHQDEYPVIFSILQRRNPSARNYQKSKVSYTPSSATWKNDWESKKNKTNTQKSTSFCRCVDEKNIVLDKLDKELDEEQKVANKRNSFEALQDKRNQLVLQQYRDLKTDEMRRSCFLSCAATTALKRFPLFESEERTKIQIEEDKAWQGSVCNLLEGFVLESEAGSRWALSTTELNNRRQLAHQWFDSIHAAAECEALRMFGKERKLESKRKLIIASAWEIGHRLMDNLDVIRDEAQQQFAIWQEECWSSKTGEYFYQRFLLLDDEELSSRIQIIIDLESFWLSAAFSSTENAKAVASELRLSIDSLETERVELFNSSQCILSLSSAQNKLFEYSACRRQRELMLKARRESLMKHLLSASIDDAQFTRSSTILVRQYTCKDEEYHEEDFMNDFENDGTNFKLLSADDEAELVSKARNIGIELQRASRSFDRSLLRICDDGGDFIDYSSILADQRVCLESSELLLRNHVALLSNLNFPRP